MSEILPLYELPKYRTYTDQTLERAIPCNRLAHFEN